MRSWLAFPTTLTRNKQWKQARAISDAGTQGRLPKGSKDKDGNIEAWTEETVCENCRQEKIVATATVDGTLHHVCEDCAQKLVPRTNSNTTQRTTDGT